MEIQPSECLAYRDDEDLEEGNLAQGQRAQ